MASADRPPAEQHAADRQRLAAISGRPYSDAGMVLCCELIGRYENTGPGSQELARAAQDQLEIWGLDRRKAFRLCRQLWFAGQLPAATSA